MVLVETCNTKACIEPVLKLWFNQQQFYLNEKNSSRQGASSLFDALLIAAYELLVELLI